jgi:hypothetical protein
LRWNTTAIRSLPPAAQSRPYSVIIAARKAVRVGALRGRWSRWCSRLSPVTHASRNGHDSTMVSSRIGAIWPGMKMFHDHVVPKMCVSQPGMIRSRPSAIPMYQSGWEPAVTFDGS